MPSQQTALHFLGIAFLLALSPGPDNLFVITLSAMRGAKAGLWLVLGLCSGLVVHTLAVALGVGAAVAASPRLLAAIKIAGALYLLYLAWGAWRASPAASATSDAPNDAGKQQNPATLQLSPVQAWWRGLLMNVSNPKVLVFFLALLPSFVQPQQGSAFTQTLCLGALFIAASWLCFSALAVLAGHIGQWLQSSAKVQRWLNRCASLVLAGLAAKLLLP